MCSAVNYSVVGFCTPNFRRLRPGRSRPRRPRFLIKRMDFCPLIGILSLMELSVIIIIIYKY